MTSDIQWIYSEYPVKYNAAVAEMEKRVAGIREGTAQEAVWILEHPALYTAGTSAKDSDLLDPRFPVFKTGRGGEYTYHGPGQLVAYVMLDLKKRQNEPDLRSFISGLEQWITDTLAVFGIRGQRREGRIGIWVDTQDGEKKIAAIGVRVRRWITYHGISINLNPDLSHFEGIVPCGIKDYGVTSIDDLGFSHVEKEDLIRAAKSVFPEKWVLR